MSSPIRSPRATGNVIPKASVRPRKIEEIVESLRTLLDGDELEQRETFSFLREALDKARRLSSRKL